MSTHMAPLPLAKKKTTSRSRPDEQAPGHRPEHHARKAPNQHLCSCGRLREKCVRDAVRDLWSYSL